MESIPIPNQGQDCSNCQKMIFAITVDGDWFPTCPICGQLSKLEGDYYPQFNHMDPDQYCTNCHTIFAIGCYHVSSGNDWENIFFGTLVSEFVYEGITYNGMPYFESYDDFCDKNETLQLTWKCMCKRICGPDRRSIKVCGLEYFQDSVNICENDITEEVFNMMNKELGGANNCPMTLDKLDSLEERYRKAVKLRKKNTFVVLYDYFIKDIYIPKELLKEIISYL